MLSITRRHADVGKELYGKLSTLPGYFYGACRSHFGMTLHQDTFIGIRSSQLRGLFLSTSSKPLEANKLIATIPLASLYTVSNIGTKPNALRHVLLEDVCNAVIEE
ncbi:hypothetical protein TraAM80_01136 [Trypanosoma rangeli]|uniref:Uncharacterized protein n=1 Tax=Trypanosoma rangeli TaxID=5698 RepID=A0A3R7P1I1_TRYRA|nr:uncharacterized protein TraAM80_01136 [Trypanosoma rangeli]RNF11204.1 hypothetical protein TraAM80_01136 [Trypanosoma rangeli]|eukprot:RNF11204.1 hypothetical protein TraAM80_01136 [Trypanosoma rangeli]